MKHYPLEMFRNGISKNTRSSVIGMIDDGIPSSSSDSAMTSKENKNRRATSKIQMKIYFYLLKQRMMYCFVKFLEYRTSILVSYNLVRISKICGCSCGDEAKFL